MNSYRYVWRFAVVFLIVAVTFFGLFYRLAFLHFEPHESVDEKIEQMHRVERPISMGRGKILDRNGHVLAIDLPARDVWIDPSRIKAEKAEREVVSNLSRLLDIEVDELFIKIKNSDKRGVRIKRFVDDDIGSKIEKLGLPGVWTKQVNIRNYPLEDTLCHVLGFINWEGDPGAGIELQYDSSLRGRDGLWVSEKDGRRKILYDRRSLKIAPMPGANIELTIDQNLQEMLANALDRMVEKYSTKGAWAIMERVKTGEILALASRPAYDPNNFRYSKENERKNRAISYVYEPGSTFKPLVVAAALNEDIVSPEDTFFCEEGCWSYKGRLLHDCHDFGELSVTEIVKKSSNVGAAKIALKLGESRLEDYLRRYGLGSQTGIDIPGEEGGILHSKENWSAISATRIAMGHEVGVTALQMLNAICATVNGGYLMRPTVVKSIRDAEGQQIYDYRPEILGRVLSSEASQEMRKIMATVTEKDGTAWRARVPGYLVGGKTGTAQKAVPGGYSHSAHVSSFVGFLPARDPEIAIIVVVDEPQPVHYGGVVAAPVFSEVAEKAVRYLHILPNNHLKYVDNRKSDSRKEVEKEL